MDWSFLGSVQETLSRLTDELTAAPPWAWLTLVLPLFWFTLADG